MTEFNPPISARETDELIAIANDNTDNWQQDAIEQAKDELRKRNVTRDYQNKILEKWEKEEENAELEYQRQLEVNATESYSIGKMVYIFLVAPFILLGKWTVDISLGDLKRENYQKKFKQRLFLLLGGTLFWILFLAVNVGDYDKQRLEEINSADISEWERKYYGIDSLNTKDSTAEKNGL